MVRLVEKHGEKTIVQHTKAVIKPNSSSAPLSQLTTARCDSMARCSDSISLTNSFTSTCTGSFPTANSMRTEKMGESSDEMKQEAPSSSTRVGSIRNSRDSTSETESATCNNVLKQVTSDPVDVTTRTKNNQMASETGEGRIGTKSVNESVTCSPLLSFCLSDKCLFTLPKTENTTKHKRGSFFVTS